MITVIDDDHKARKFPNAKGWEVLEDDHLAVTSEEHALGETLAFYPRNRWFAIFVTEEAK
jgi:hypothetical protein